MKRIPKRSEPDNRCINLEDEYAVIFWTKELHITTEKLKAAVNAVGPVVSDVHRELKRKPVA